MRRSKGERLKNEGLNEKEKKIAELIETGQETDLHSRLQLLYKLSVSTPSESKTLTSSLLTASSRPPT